MRPYSRVIGEEIEHDPNRLTFLDGIRGLSVILVCWSHSVELFGEFGGFGVSVFFVLSGFLLSFRLLIELERAERTTLTLSLQNQTTVVLEYFLKRFFRIYPNYLLAISIASFFPFLRIGFGFPIEDDAIVEVFWNHVFMRRLLYHLWTMRVECSFYALLPVIVVFYKACDNFRSWRTSSLVFFALSMVLLMHYLDGVLVAEVRSGKPHFNFPVVAYYPQLLQGALAGIVYHVAVKNKWTLRHGKIATALPFISGILAVIHRVQHLKAVIPFLNTGPRFLIFEAFLLSLMIFFGTFSCPFSEAFENTALAHMGKISFSVYLMHPMYLHVIRNLLIPSYYALKDDPNFKKYEIQFVIFVLFMPVCVALGTLQYEYVEKKCAIVCNACRRILQALLSKLYRLAYATPLVEKFNQ
ncbi:hypothetical protein HDV01_004715 [Terramyces sp. JEL0728]|nr:hypothetical protein HDV01_004715 [Terramyces sp. JEL0728]